MRNFQESTAIKVAIFFGCATIFLTAIQVGLPLKGIQINPALGNAFLVLALLSLLGLLATLGWIFIPWIRNLWAGIEKRWPFALARTVRQLRTELSEARDRIEQLELENENVKADRESVYDLQLDTKRENAELKQELHDAKQECERLREQNIELRNQRDQQIRVRCRKLADDLARLLKGWERHDPKNKEALREYNNRFKADATRLIRDLKAVEQWMPEVDDPEYLEKPENRQDVQNLYNYLRWVYLGFPR